jgi:DNA-binding NtrC family response regulator
LRRYSTECSRHLSGIEPGAMALLKNYDWPGNVRELQNAIERAVALGSSDLIRPEDLPENLYDEAGENLSSSRYRDAVAEAQRNVILDALAQSKGNIVEAADILGLNSNYLHRLIHKLNLKSRLQSLR